MCAALDKKTFYLRWHLHITVNSAKDLMAMDFMSKSDPMAKLHRKSAPWDVYSTKIQNNTLTPVWKEEKFDFFFYDEEDVIVVELYDYDKLPFERYQPLGSLLLKTHHFTELGPIGGEYTKEFTLVPPAGYEKSKAGTVNLTLYINHAWIGRLNLRIDPSYVPDYSQFKYLVLEGGGVKGIAYGGACEVLEKKGILSQLTHVAGTSAGALAALVLAVGASGARMKEILLKETNFDTYMDKLFHSFIATFAVKHSLFEGEALEKDIKLKMHDLLTEGLKPLQAKGVDLGFLGSLHDVEERLTFADLAKLHQLDPKTFKNLSCVGTNVTLQRAQVFSARNSPTFPLWKAVRISMSIPLFFPAVFVDGAYFVDGGVAYNYPIDLFDAGDDVNYATLGLRLDTPKEISVALSNFQNPAPRNLRMANTVIDGGETKEPAFNLVTYVSNLLSYLMDQVNDGKMRRIDDRRTCYISSGSVGSTDFGLSQEKKDGLCVNGENAVTSFFTWWDIDQKNRLQGQAATAKH